MATIRIKDDFNLAKITESGQCFRAKEIQPELFRFITLNHVVYIKKIDDGVFDVSCNAVAWERIWEPYFDLAENYGKIRAQIDRQQDSFLYEAAEDQKGNKNIPAIKKSVELLARYAGGKLMDSYDKEYYAFPTPEAIAAMREEDLTACKVGYRWKYIKAAANDILNGNLNLAKLLHTEETETIQKLTEVYGVGIKVASCVSLYGLHHTDAFPIDVWMKRILADKYPNGYPFESYSPYNGIYQQYLFAYYRKQFT